jgi:hypothetical protein
VVVAERLAAGVGAVERPAVAGHRAAAGRTRRVAVAAVDRALAHPVVAVTTKAGTELQARLSIYWLLLLSFTGDNAYALPSTRSCSILPSGSR